MLYPIPSVRAKPQSISLFEPTQPGAEPWGRRCSNGSEPRRESCQVDGLCQAEETGIWNGNTSGLPPGTLGHGGKTMNADGHWVLMPKHLELSRDLYELHTHTLSSMRIYSIPQEELLRLCEARVPHTPVCSKALQSSPVCGCCTE